MSASAGRPLGGFALGLVGHPIDKSLSPPMHEAALKHLGLEGGYARLAAPTVDGLARAFEAMATGQLAGFNVTLPWKHEAARLCEARGGALCGAAATLGVANTLVARGASGRLEGHNTDVPGLIAAIRERWPDFEVAPGGVACVLGAGGAGYAAVLAASALGFEEIRVWNRTAEAAQTLVQRLGCGRVVERLDAATRGVSLVLQATTVGMGASGPAYAELESFARGALAPTAEGAKVVDLVYQPRPTVWVAAARALGREADDGLSMLVHQAALAFALWTGHPPPVVVMRAALEAELRVRG